MTAAERLLLILLADLVIATNDEGIPPGHPLSLLKARIKNARHALDAEAFWAANKEPTA